MRMTANDMMATIFLLLIIGGGLTLWGVGWTRCWT